MLALGMLLLMPRAAWAYFETSSTVDNTINATNCAWCHTEYPGFGAPSLHYNYLTTTRKCAICHSVHKAPDSRLTSLTSSVMLLPGPTVKATCLTCHDGTQGKGVYGTIAARGLAVGAQHRCETTNVIPGGNGATGGSATMTLSGPNATLSCNDCHSVHGSSVVATFMPERRRMGGWSARIPVTNLLKQRPGTAASSTTVYGSDWCGACHRGRLSGTGLHTHPVDSKASLPAPPNGTNYYERLSILTTDGPTSLTTTGTLGGTNRGYLMPFPRTTQQAGHSPICQQCHEDSRNVGALDPSGAPADAATFTVTSADGWTASDNPRFQNFPHETVNTRMLVETGDDLCTNCHPAGILP